MQYKQSVVCAVFLTGEIQLFIYGRRRPSLFTVPIIQFMTSTFSKTFVWDLNLFFLRITDCPCMLEVLIKRVKCYFITDKCYLNSDFITYKCYLKCYFITYNMLFIYNYVIYNSTFFSFIILLSSHLSAFRPSFERHTAQKASRFVRCCLCREVCR